MRDYVYIPVNHEFSLQMNGSNNMSIYFRNILGKIVLSGWPPDLLHGWSLILISHLWPCAQATLTVNVQLSLNMNPCLLFRHKSSAISCSLYSEVISVFYVVLHLMINYL